MRTDPARSLTSGFTPLSITATMTPAPWVSCQAAGTFIMSRTHCWLTRTLSADAAVAGSTASAAAQPSAARIALPRRHQHPGAPGQCGLAGWAASVSATDRATPWASIVISVSE